MRDMHRMRDRIDLQLDNRQIVSFVIGSLVVLGVVFALGVLVGKQLAVGSLEPQPAGDPLAALDAAEAARQRLEADDPDEPAPAAASGAAAQQPTAAELTYAEVLTGSRDVDPAIEPVKARPAPKKAEPAEARAAPPPEPARPPERRQGLADAFQKATGGSAPRGDWCLQVASLPTRADADREVARLAKQGWAAYVVEADVPGKGHFFRVRIGGYETRAAADQALADFKRKTGAAAFVTSR
jgi:DedD protein